MIPVVIFMVYEIFCIQYARAHSSARMPPSPTSRFSPPVAPPLPPQHQPPTPSRIRMAARWSVTLPILLLIAPPLAAQSEADLKRYFEGKRVVLRIDMPGTEQGVDVYPGTDRPLDYPRYASRL